MNEAQKTERADVVIVGAGAAGLMAAIWAGRAGGGRRIVLLDGARKLGTKILIAGGGRCNVTHEQVTAADYAGSTPNAIRKVLLRFDVPETIAFFAELGVTLKREETGKLFPTTDQARTVLAALLRGVAAAGVKVRHPNRVAAITRTPAGYQVAGDWGAILAPRLILATGGQSVPQTGSDGFGYRLAQALGHSLTPHIFPALVPLLLPAGHFLRDLSGLSLPVTLTVVSGTGQRLVSFTEALLCTHFGLSGPAVLNVSRYYLDTQWHAPAGHLHCHWLPGRDEAQIDQELQNLGGHSLLRWLRPQLPERLARALCAAAGLAPETRGGDLTRPGRKTLLRTLCALPLPISGSRGFRYAEVTAGGVPLAELVLKTLESRHSPGLHLCGEICDVDGRIGGFNFQWAWASGYVAGVAAGVA